jgi:hypothetical protein
MRTYRLRYRTAAAGEAAAGDWIEQEQEVTVATPPSGPYKGSLTFADLTNGVTYEFAVGRVRSGVVSQWSTLRQATPSKTDASGTYDSLGTFQVADSKDIQTIERTSTNTVLTVKPNWEYVTIDYTDGGNALKHGVTKTSGFTLPGGYTTNAVIFSGSNNTVTINLGPSVQVVIRIKGNGASIATYTLLAV